MARITEKEIHGVMTEVIEMDAPADELEDALRAQIAAEQAIESSETAQDAAERAEEAALRAEENIAGVSSFNGRHGAVKPQAGDYTAKDVGALPDTGGTLSGPLKFLDGFADINGDQNKAEFRSFATKDDTRVGRALSLRNQTGSSALKEVFKLWDFDNINGVTKGYNIYGEHNKPTASDVGAIATPAKVTGSGAVTVTLANNKEYTYTGVTTLKMTGAAVECHGFVTFGSSAPTVTMSGFTKVGGDPITSAKKSEIWEFSCFNKYILWKNWSA